MEKVAEYHFTTESIMLSRDKNPAISGKFYCFKIFFISIFFENTYF